LLGAGMLFSLTAYSGAMAHGEKSVSVSQDAGGNVKWILPGPRMLDPVVFGSPAQPTALKNDVGLPVKMRKVSADGKSFTMTAGPTPFSDRFKPATGSFSMQLTDITRFDSMESKDRVSGEFRFTDPSGKKNYVVKIKKVIPKGSVHQFFGGVLVDGILHGTTEFGTALMPTMYNYGAFWAVGELSINGKVVSGNRVVHVMTSENVRSPESSGYKLLMDKDLPHKGIQTHLILPPTVATPQGPKPGAVPSGFKLPNGKDQPFIHIMYDTNKITGLPVLWRIDVLNIPAWLSVVRPEARPG